MLLPTDPVTTGYLRRIAREAKEGSVKFEPEMKKMEPHRRPPPWVWTDQFLRNMVAIWSAVALAFSPRRQGGDEEVQ